MNEVHVLFEGYSTQNPDGSMSANCSCVLIKTGEVRILVDSMTPWDGPKIKESLSQHHCLSQDDIDFVVSTHGHSDHVGNNNLFLKATHIVGHSMSHKDKYFEHDFDASSFTLSPGVFVKATPGHTLDSVSVIVTDTRLGTIAIVGDLFEKEEDLLDDQVWIEAGSENVSKQRQNRAAILALADQIVPGHG
ncbi:metallo-beta-lactamase domain-containing protein 1-like, partial [Tigriopus californicus]